MASRGRHPRTPKASEEPRENALNYDRAGELGVKIPVAKKATWQEPRSAEPRRARKGRGIDLDIRKKEGVPIYRHALGNIVSAVAIARMVPMVEDTSGYEAMWQIWIILVAATKQVAAPGLRVA